MLNSFNIDRSDSEINTNFPFQWQCRLQLGSVQLPSGLIRSIRVHCTEGILPPVRLHKVQINGDNGTAEFRDSQGVSVCFWKFSYKSSDTRISAFLTNSYNVISGHIVCSEELPAMLFSIAAANNNEVTTESDDFLLLPQCHTSSLSGYCKAFKIGDTVYNSDLTIKSGAYTSSEFKGGVYSISLLGKYAVDTDSAMNRDGIMQLSVNGETYYVGGRHLLIRAGMTSNLRVVMANSAITLKGVQDD
jgi:hypothetical protein